MNISKIDCLVIRLDDEKEPIFDSCKTITNYFRHYGFEDIINKKDISKLIEESELDDGYKCVVIEKDTKTIIFEYPYLENPGDYCINYTDIKSELIV